MFLGLNTVTSTTRNTYAYPTKLYDPAGNYSEVKYRFDTGANVWARSPAPAGNTTGKESTREYDAVGQSRYLNVSPEEDPI